jgi:hypothetical protein
MRRREARIARNRGGVKAAAALYLDAGRRSL